MKSHLNIFKTDTKTNRIHQPEIDLIRALAISLQEDTLFFHEVLKAVFKDSNRYNTLYKNLYREISFQIEIQKEYVQQISEYEHVFAVSLSANKMVDFWSQKNATGYYSKCDLVISIKNILIVINVKRDAINCTSQLYNQTANILKKQGKELSKCKEQVTPVHLNWRKLMAIAVKAASFEKTSGNQNRFLNDFIQLVKEHNFKWLPESPMVSLKSTNKAAIKRRVTSAVNQFCEDTEYVTKIPFHDRLGFFFSCELTNELLFDVDTKTGDLVASIYPGRTKRAGDSIFQSDSQFNKEFEINKNIYRVNIDREISIEIPFFELQKLDQTQNDLSNLGVLLSEIHTKFSKELLLNQKKVKFRE
jgi:hypothetical protein